MRFYDRYEYARTDRAVIVQSSLLIRQGDGEEFDLIAKRVDVEGDVVTVLGHRAGWAKVQLSDGTTGWVNAEQLSPMVVQRG